MTIEIKNRFTGKVMMTIDADTLRGANLSGANLIGANTKYAKVNFSPDEYEQAKQWAEGLK